MVAGASQTLQKVNVTALKWGIMGMRAAIVATALLGLTVIAPSTAEGQACTIYTGAFARLAASLGPIMGEPIGCPHYEPGNPDVIQWTTTGVASLEPGGGQLGTIGAKFTNGHQHWQDSPDGIFYWEGASPDMPAGACGWLDGRPIASGSPDGALGLSPPTWVVVVGSFGTEAEVAAAVPICATVGPGGFLWSSNFGSLRPGYWVSYVGPYPNRETATEEAERLRANGFPEAYPRWVAR